MNTISLNSQGSDVSTLQSDLNRIGGYGLVVDGNFGPATQAAVIYFQQKHGLFADGIVGPLTWSALSNPAIPPLPLPVPSAVIKGIDVYHDDDVTDWNAIKAAGYQFVFIKCTEGTSIDPKYATYKAAAKAAGLLVGAYHFFHPNLDVTQCAKLFLSTMGSLSPGDLPPVLDWETHEGTAAHEVSQALIWLQTVQATCGRTPIIYSGYYYIGEVGNPASIAPYPLWLAEYVASPLIPQPYSKYTFWQYSGSAEVPGVGNPCDVSVFNGSQDDLNKLAGL